MQLNVQRCHWLSSGSSVTCFLEDVSAVTCILEDVCAVKCTTLSLAVFRQFGDVFSGGRQCS